MEKWGGKVGVIHTKNGMLFHLKRGEIYTINNKKILIIGGAESQDKGNRKENIDWWKEEVLSKEEENYILTNLDKHQWKIDYILSHTCPNSIGHEMANFAWAGPYGDQGKYNRYLSKASDPVSRFLEFIKNNLDFKEWHFGHWHIDKKMNNFYCHYNHLPFQVN